MKPNYNFWKNKKVLITGHTGFKGGWLSMFLHCLGSKVIGYALNPISKKNIFELANIKKTLIKDYRKNICDIRSLNNCIKKHQPEIIFHLAAQSSVIESFKNSNNTVLSNIMGTVNLLEVLKNNNKVRSVVIITTDKVYQNYKSKKLFNESSSLGGDDVYSGTKACCELLINSYRKSFFSKKNNICNIASVRAGNCFGGGDWTKDRIVKDALENFYDNKALLLRNPAATRPWQHVMEPITGYLLLAERLYLKKQGKNFSCSWNFGPKSNQNMQVKKLALLIKKNMNSLSKIKIKKKDKRFHNKKINIFESKYLQIDSTKAFKKLNWKPKLTIQQAVLLTVEWYKDFKKNKDLFNKTKKQIQNYLN
jgi:CDP-glucose 4,6-dehydratase